MRNRTLECRTGTRALRFKTRLLSVNVSYSLCTTIEEDVFIRYCGSSKFHAGVQWPLNFFIHIQLNSVNEPRLLRSVGLIAWLVNVLMNRCIF